MPRRAARGLAGAVFAIGTTAERKAARLFFALAVALLSHAATWQWARFNDTHSRAAVPETPKPIEVALEPPPAPPPPPPEPDPPKVEPARAVRSAAKASRPIAPPSAPARAATIIAQEPQPDAPVDFDAVVTGSAHTYAGGATATSGTQQHAVTTAASGPVEGTRKAGPATPLSRAVALAEDEWQCPWPHEAEADDIDETAVVLRASVRADGRVASVRILTDPGHGFGRAALACAMHTHFTPALDMHGKPTAAQSSPIRVRFTR